MIYYPFGVPVNGGTAAVAAPGDIQSLGEQLQANATVGAAVLTVQQMFGILNRTGSVANFNDTTPDANSILLALLGNNYQGGGNTTPLGVNAGTTWRLRYINTVAFIATIVAGSGITLAGTTAVAASSVKEFLLTVLNGTLQQLFSCATTNASAVVTGLTAAQTSQLTPGMAVSGTGIAGGTTILSVQPGVGVTLSANATATNNPVALTFSPRIEMRSIGQMLL